MKTAAVLPAQGIGDALLMLIASYNLQEAGYAVTTYQPLLSELAPWLKTKEFGSLPNTYELENFLSSKDLIILQNDNSPKARHLIELRRFGKLPNLIIFYPTYKADKHGPLSPQDYVFIEDLSMVENIAKATSKLLNLAGVSRNNGLSPLENLSYRKQERRVVIHPTSSQEEKNWPAKKFITLGSKLKKKGYDVVFAMSRLEHPKWQQLLSGRWDAPLLSSLSDLAALIYESGYVIGNDSLVGHLASNLQIPTIIVANEEKRMRLWRPGWLKGEVITPSPFWRRWSNSHWTALISVGKVLDRFCKLARSF